MDSVVGLNPSLDLLGVVLVGTGTNSKQVHKVTRDHLTADFGTDEVLFPMSIRHAEATAQACRERGLLAHELERHSKHDGEYPRRAAEPGAGRIPGDQLRRRG
jgi:chromosome partitioning protein